MADFTLDDLIVYYERAHKMGVSDLSRRTTALQTKEFLEELVELRERAAKAEAKVAFAIEQAEWHKTGMTASIPLGPPDREYDPNDEFKRCAVDRAHRVSDFVRNLKAGFRNIDAGEAPE